MKSHRSAVTRIELLVVIAIVALLPAVITASLGTARNLAKIPLCANNLRQIGLAVYDYAQIFDGNLPNVRMPAHISSSGSEESHFYVQYREDHRVAPDNSRLQPYRFACLYEAGLIEDARLFYCPANTDPARMYKSYTNPLPPNTSTEWGTLPQLWNAQNYSNSWVRSGYEWFPVDKNPELERISIGGRPKAPRYLCRRFDNLDPNLPYITDIMRTREQMSHKYDEVVGLNTLYIDGRVVFCDDPDVFSHRAWDRDPYSSARPEAMSIYYERILLLAGRHPSQAD